MKLLARIADALAAWIDGVAAAIVALRGWLAAPRSVQLVESEEGVFTFRRSGRKADAAVTDAFRVVDGHVAGPLSPAAAKRLKAGRVELLLQPDRFMFRPLELPARAADFLDGIVRAQIDRLTPGSPADAAFGWSPPTPVASDRIAVTVAATARAVLDPLIGALAGLGANQVVLSTAPPGADPGGAPIRVLDHRVRGALQLHRVRRVLVAVLLLSGLAAIGAGTASVVVGGDLEAQQADVSHRIAARRVSLRANLDASGEALAALERHKHEVPSSVIVLEALSRILPDHTYVTELRIIGDKMQVIGITRDAPSLIRLIEQSANFTRATFFAPTTRSPSEPGEHFHIEARIEPVYTPHS